VITRLAHAVVLSWGWRRAAIAFFSGAASALAMAPVDAWPVLFFTFPLAVWLIDGADAGRGNGVPAAMAAGWVFGFGYFLAGLYWVGYAFLVDAKTFGWALPFAVILLPAGLAVFTAAGFALARLAWSRKAARILALAIALTVTEWLRGHLLSGFPWNAFGYALSAPLALAQAGSLFGLWGLTFFAVAIFASPATLADDREQVRRPWLPLALGVAVLAAFATYGAVRMLLTPTQFVQGVKLRLVQPNLRQDEKFNYAAKQDIMNRYVALSDRATGPRSNGVSDVTHLIWPESAFPFFLAREADALAQIAALLPPTTVLITGAVRAVEPVTTPQELRAYNSVYVIDHEGSFLSIYDKVHLVPFGEYLPFQNLLEKLGVMQLTKMPGGFLAGDRHRSYDIPRAPKFMPLLCYEIIFPGVFGTITDRPGWLVNLTNDAWFGISSGPYQHLRQARMRAIEEGLPVVRAANSGISAVFDPLGHTIDSLPLGSEGILDSGLPRALAPTLYARTGDALAGLVLLFAGIIVLRRRVQNDAPQF
jgi:apolipoprotein N-acyltransferase